MNRDVTFFSILKCMCASKNILILIEFFHEQTSRKKQCGMCSIILAVYSLEQIEMQVSKRYINSIYTRYSITIYLFLENVNGTQSRLQYYCIGSYVIQNLSMFIFQICSIFTKIWQQILLYTYYNTSAYFSLRHEITIITRTPFFFQTEISKRQIKIFRHSK